jgi:hypothetical protein
MTITGLETRPIASLLFANINKPPLYLSVFFLSSTTEFTFSPLQ